MAAEVHVLLEQRYTPVRPPAMTSPELTKPEIQAELKAATGLFAGLLAERAAIVRETVPAPLDAADKALLGAINALAALRPGRRRRLTLTLVGSAAASPPFAESTSSLRAPGRRGG